MIKKVTLLGLALPNFIEMIFFSLLGMCDMFILSRVSDDAAGGVGACNQIITFVFIAFNIICVGTSVLVSQYIGARDMQSAQKAIMGSFMVLSLVGIAGSALLFFFGGGILKLIGVSPNLMQHAHIYMRIIGGTIFLQALLNITTIVMRVYGHAKESLYITAGMNHGRNLHVGRFRARGVYIWSRAGLWDARRHHGNGAG